MQCVDKAKHFAKMLRSPIALTRQSDTDTFWLEVAFIWKQKSIQFRSIKQSSIGLICFNVYLVGNMRTKRHQNQDILFSTLPSTTWQSSVCSYEWNMTQVLKTYKHGAGDFSDGRLTTRPNWPKKVRQLKQRVNSAKFLVTNWVLGIWAGLEVKRGFYGNAWEGCQGRCLGGFRGSRQTSRGSQGVNSNIWWVLLFVRQYRWARGSKRVKGDVDGSKGVKEGVEVSKGVNEEVWWVFWWFVRHICLYICHADFWHGQADGLCVRRSA